MSEAVESGDGDKGQAIVGPRSAGDDCRARQPRQGFVSEAAGRIPSQPLFLKLRGGRCSPKQDEADQRRNKNRGAEEAGTIREGRSEAGDTQAQRAR